MKTSKGEGAVPEVVSVSASSILICGNVDEECIFWSSNLRMCPPLIERGCLDPEQYILIEPNSKLGTQVLFVE